MKLSAELSLSEIVYDRRQIARAGLEDHFLRQSPRHSV